jgi:signal transduction histidine kinase
MIPKVISTYPYQATAPQGEFTMAPEEQIKAPLQAELEKAQQRISELETLGDTCRLMEANLSRQNQFFHQVLESLTHPFYVLDAKDYTIVVANSAARLGNLAAKPTCYALTHRRGTPCDGSEHTCPLQEVKRTKQPVIVEHTHYDKDGNPRDMEVHAYPIFDENGEVAQMIEYSLDITERKKLEEKIQDFAEKIKRFAYSVSHDLKNPLISIHGLTNLLVKQYRDRFDEKGKVFCDQIMKESQHALVLIEEINTYIKTKETPLKFEPLDVKEILAQVREEFHTSLTNRGLHWSEPEAIPEVKADRMSLVRVFRNFVDNALKYGGPKLSRISIGYEGSEDFHIFSVRDDGVGIGAEQVQKIFGAFQRGESSQGQEGTGLGLAIVEEIAARHGGQAWVKPGLENGATFYISLAKKL